MKKEDYYDKRAKSQEFSYRVILVCAIILIVIGFLNLILRF